MINTQDSQILKHSSSAGIRLKKLLGSLICVLLLMTFISLGFWQLDRADQKAEQEQHVQKQLSTQALDLNRHSDALHPYQPAFVSGHYIEEDQFLLDNIPHQGKTGYYVICPFKVAKLGSTILVNRGWLPKSFLSTDLPDTRFENPNTNLTIHGILAHPRSKPVITGNVDKPISQIPQLWYYMDVPFFEANAGYKVLPLVLRLSPEKDSRFVRDWPKYEAKTGMHIGYAIQWFVFAFFVLIMWILILKKSKTKNNKG